MSKFLVSVLDYHELRGEIRQVKTQRHLSVGCNKSIEKEGKRRSTVSHKPCMRKSVIEPYCRQKVLSSVFSFGIEKRKSWRIRKLDKILPSELSTSG